MFKQIRQFRRIKKLPGKYGSKRKDYQFKKSFFELSGVRRRYELDVSVLIFGGRVTLVGSTNVYSQNLLDRLSTNAEWTDMAPRYAFYRIRGVAVKWCTQLSTQNPFSIDILPSSLTTITSESANLSDTRLAVDGSFGGPVSKYYSLQGEPYMNPGNYTVGGPVWQASSTFDPAHHYINLMIGNSLTNTTIQNNTFLGTIRCTIYVDHCKTQVGLT